MAIDIITRKTLTKRFFSIATCFAVITIIGLLLFPPWCTFVYHEVSFHWFRNAPPPDKGLGYQIDMVRLEMRIALVVLAYVIALIGNKLYVKLPYSFGSIVLFAGTLFAVSFVGFIISKQLEAQETDIGWVLGYISTAGLLIGGVMLSASLVRETIERCGCSKAIAK